MERSPTFAVRARPPRGIAWLVALSLLLPVSAAAEGRTLMPAGNTWSVPRIGRAGTEVACARSGCKVRLRSPSAWRITRAGTELVLARVGGDAVVKVWTEPTPGGVVLTNEGCLSRYTATLRERLASSGLEIRESSTRQRPSPLGLPILVGSWEGVGSGPRRHAGRYLFAGLTMGTRCQLFEGWVRPSASAEVIAAVKRVRQSFDVVRSVADESGKKFLETARRDASFRRGARKSLSAACVHGNDVACRGLMLLAVKGGPAAAGQAHSRALLARQCRRGRAAACAGWGLLMERGVGGGADKAGARRLYRKACDGSDAEGCFRFGFALSRGVGGKREPARARGFLKMSCSRDHGLACYELGTLVENGDGGSTDLKTARRLFKRTCALDVAGGCYNLARLVAAGRGGTPDRDAAERLLQRSCDLGEAQACTVLGLELGSRQRDAAVRRRARGPLERGCKLGQQRACHALAMLLLEGRPSLADERRGRSLLERVCRDGVAAACRLSRIAASPGGFSGMRKRLEAACEKGGATACYGLAGLFARGLGGTVDREGAKALLSRTCKRGLTIACKTLAELSK